MAKPKRQRALRPARVFKNKKARAKQSTFFFRFILILFILLMLFGAIGTYFFRYRVSLLSFKVPDWNNSLAISNQPPQRLKISSASIDLQIYSARIKAASWPTFDDAATHIANSANPLDNSNIIVYAPNQLGLFHNLDQVKIGDVVILETKDRKHFEYLVQEVRTVSPEENSYLLPTTSEVVTLFTSSGFLNSKRLVVRAIPIRVPNF